MIATTTPQAANAQGADKSYDGSSSSISPADIDADPRLALLVRRPGGGRDSLFLSLEPARQALADSERHGIRTEIILVRLVPLLADLSDFGGDQQ